MNRTTLYALLFALESFSLEIQFTSSMEEVKLAQFTTLPFSPKEVEPQVLRGHKTLSRAMHPDTLDPISGLNHISLSPRQQ